MASPQRKCYALKIKNFGPQTIHTTIPSFPHTPSISILLTLSPLQPSTEDFAFVRCRYRVLNLRPLRCLAGAFTPLSVAGREFKVTKEPLAAEIIPVHAL